MLLYLFQVSVCLLCFYACYYFVFRKYSFFSLNRWYLLCAILASFLISKITIEKQIIVSQFEPIIQTETLNNIGDQQILPLENATIKAETFWQTVNWLQLAKYIYLLVAFIFFLKLVYAIFEILKLRRRAQNTNGYWIV